MKNLLILLCLGIAAMSAFGLGVSTWGSAPQGGQGPDLARAEAPINVERRGAPKAYKAVDHGETNSGHSSISIESSAYCIHGEMASGQITFTGAAASNFLPFRSRWLITSGPLKTKEVQILDRHNRRYHKLLDIWIEDCNQALQYGRRQITAERIRRDEVSIARRLDESDLPKLRLYISDQVDEERDRQDEKWGEQNHDDFTWMAILSEEVGELAQAMLHTWFGGDRAHLRLAEAIQVAAVAQAYCECLHREAIRGRRANKGDK